MLHLRIAYKVLYQRGCCDKEKAQTVSACQSMHEHRVSWRYMGQLGVSWAPKTTLACVAKHLPALVLYYSPVTCATAMQAQVVAGAAVQLQTAGMAWDKEPQLMSINEDESTFRLLPSPP